MLNTEETLTCPVLTAPDNCHFEGRCEDCNVQRLSRMTLDQVADLHYLGRITQDEFEAYMHVWAILSPHGGQAQWRFTPEIPDVRRIARKLLRVREFGVPAELAD